MSGGDVKQPCVRCGKFEDSNSYVVFRALSECITFDAEYRHMCDYCVGDILYRFKKVIETPDAD